MCGVGSEEEKGQHWGVWGLGRWEAGMGCRPNLRREEQQWVYFPCQGAAVGLQKA